MKHKIKGKIQTYNMYTCMLMMGRWAKCLQIGKNNSKIFAISDANFLQIFTNFDPIGIRGLLVWMVN